MKQHTPETTLQTPGFTRDKLLTVRRILCAVFALIVVVLGFTPFLTITLRPTESQIYVYEAILLRASSVDRYGNDYVSESIENLSEADRAWMARLDNSSLPIRELSEEELELLTSEEREAYDKMLESYEERCDKRLESILKHDMMWREELGDRFDIVNFIDPAEELSSDPEKRDEYYRAAGISELVDFEDEILKTRGFEVKFSLFRMLTHPVAALHAIQLINNCDWLAQHEDDVFDFSYSDDMSEEQIRQQLKRAQEKREDYEQVAARLEDGSNYVGITTADIDNAAFLFGSLTMEKRDQGAYTNKDKINFEALTFGGTPYQIDPFHTTFYSEQSRVWFFLLELALMIALVVAFIKALVGLLGKKKYTTATSALDCATTVVFIRIAMVIWQDGTRLPLYDDIIGEFRLTGTAICAIVVILLSMIVRGVLFRFGKLSPAESRFLNREQLIGLVEAAASLVFFLAIVTIRVTAHTPNVAILTMWKLRGSLDSAFTMIYVLALFLPLFAAVFYVPFQACMNFVAPMPLKPKKRAAIINGMASSSNGTVRGLILKAIIFTAINAVLIVIDAGGKLIAISIISSLVMIAAGVFHVYSYKRARRDGIDPHRIAVIATDINNATDAPADEPVSLNIIPKAEQPVEPAEPVEQPLQ